jgi:hypothetical protein
MWLLSSQYKKVPVLDLRTSSGNDDEECAKTEINSVIRYFIVLLVLANTITLGFLGAFPKSSLPPPHTHITHSSPSKAVSPAKQNPSCGSTVSSARASNCSFDLLSNSWIPTTCYDSETDMEFRSWITNANRTHGAWPYFTSKSLSPSTHIHDEATLSSMPGVWLWSTQEQHIGHCIFWAKRVHRTLQGNIRPSRSVQNMKHSFHCANEVLDSLMEAPLEKVNMGVVHFKVQFDTCA